MKTNFDKINNRSWTKVTQSNERMAWLQEKAPKSQRLCVECGKHGFCWVSLENTKSQIPYAYFCDAHCFDVWSVKPYEKYTNNQEISDADLWRLLAEAE